MSLNPMYFAGIKSDGKARKDMHMLRWTPNSLERCELCGAHLADPVLTYTNMGDDAPWRNTFRTLGEYIAESPPHRLSPWLQIPGFVCAQQSCWWHCLLTIFINVGGLNICGAVFVLQTDVPVTMRVLVGIWC